MVLGRKGIFAEGLVSCQQLPYVIVDLRPSAVFIDDDTKSDVSGLNPASPAVQPVGSQPFLLFSLEPLAFKHNLNTALQRSPVLERIYSPLYSQTK